MTDSKVNVLPHSVLVTGANGYIGLVVASAFRKAGYFVYGIVRDEKKAAPLREREIFPVIGDLTNLEGLRPYIEAASIIVDCVYLHYLEHPDKPSIELLKLAEEYSKKRDPLFPPKTHIYTSGIMVYGHDERVRNEAFPIGSTIYSNWRRNVEEHVIHSADVNGIVIRPGWVFGGSGGPYGNDMFQNPEKIVLRGKNHNRRYSWIHVDDLAEAYVAAAHKSAAARGLIFNIVNGVDAPVHSELLLKAARLYGFKGEVQWEENKEWLDHALDSNVVLLPTLATTVLGWTPKVFGFYEYLELFYESNKALRIKN